MTRPLTLWPTTAASQAPSRTYLIARYKDTLLLCDEKPNDFTQNLLHTANLAGQVQWSHNLKRAQAPVHASEMIDGAVVVSCYGNGSSNTAGVAVVRGIGTDSVTVEELVIAEYGHNIHFANVFHPRSGDPFVLAVDLNGRLLYRVSLKAGAMSLTPVFNASSLNPVPDHTATAFPPCTPEQEGRANPRRWRQNKNDSIIVLSEECAVGLWELHWDGERFSAVSGMKIDLSTAISGSKQFLTGTELQISQDGAIYVAVRRYADKSFSPAVAGSLIELAIETDPTHFGAARHFEVKREVVVGTNPRHFILQDKGAPGSFAYVANQESSSAMKISIDSFEVVQKFDAPIGSHPAFVLDLE